MEVMEYLRGVIFEFEVVFGGGDKFIFSIVFVSICLSGYVLVRNLVLLLFIY